MNSTLINHPVISNRYFFPRRAPLPGATMVDVSGAQLACWHTPAQPGQKTFLHFHGNGEIVADYLPDYAQAIAELGLGVFLAEYRGYGGSSGTPQLGEMLEDVEHIYRALGIPAQELVVYGRSVGSLFAVELAHRHPELAGLILESGVADVLQRLLCRLHPEELGATEQELAATIEQRLDHRIKLGSYGNPLLVLHALDDDMVTPDHARSNFHWAAGENKEIVWFEFGGHNGLLVYNFPKYLEEIKRFVQSL